MLLGIYLAVAFFCRADWTDLNFIFQEKDKPSSKKSSNDDNVLSSSNVTINLRLRGNHDKYTHSIMTKNATELVQSSTSIQHLVQNDDNTTTTTNSSTSEEKDEQITLGEESKNGQYKKPNCLIFMHIPKSGGSSLKVLLENITRTERYSLEGVYSKTVRSPHPLKVNNTFIMGHFTTAIFQLRPEFLKCYKVTIIREPIERAISAFFFHGHQTHEVDYCLGREGINKCKLNWQYKNDLTRYIAGSPKTKWNTYLEYTYNSYPMNETHVSISKEHLKKYFDLVCFTTDLKSCARNITSTFQVNTENPSINLSFYDDRKKGVHFNKEKPRLNQTLFDTFRIANSIDSELYKWAALQYGH